MINNYFKNKTILITGATGSLGKALINKFVNDKVKFKKIIVFSRDELKQLELQNKINKN